KDLNAEAAEFGAKVAEESLLCVTLRNPLRPLRLVPSLVTGPPSFDTDSLRPRIRQLSSYRFRERYQKIALGLNLPTGTFKRFHLMGPLVVLRASAQTAYVPLESCFQLS